MEFLKNSAAVYFFVILFLPLFSLKLSTYVYFQVTLFHAGIEDYATANTSLVSHDVQVIATSTNDHNLFAPCMVGTLESQFLKIQMQVSGAKKVLDIGTFTGKDI